MTVRVSSRSRALKTMRKAALYLLTAAVVNALLAFFAGLFGHRQIDVFFTLSMVVGVLFLAAGYLLDSVTSPRGREARRILYKSETRLTDAELRQVSSRADAFVISGLVLLVVGFLGAVVRPF